MPRTFNDALASDVEVLLQTFGEDCSFHPKSSGPRDIVAIVDEDGSFQETGRGRYSESVVLIGCRRNAITGIDVPQLGDGFRPERMPDGILWSFQGVYREADTHFWWLAFQRTLPYQLGGNR